MPVRPSSSSTSPSATRRHAATDDPPTGQPLHARVLGTHIVVTSLPNAERARLADLLRPFLIADAAAQTGDAPVVAFSAVWNTTTGLWDVLGEGQFLNGVPTAEAMLLQLEWRVMSAGLERVEGCGVFHAGALTRGDATVLVQGNSGAGKTTLTLGLMARGWLPLADDTSVVDVRTLAVRAFPRCFHVEPARKRPIGARPRLARVASVAANARPMRWGPEGRQPTAILTVSRDPGQPSSLTPLLRAEAAGALLEGAIRARLDGSQVADLAARIAATVRYCGHLNNSDLSQALDLVEAACTQ
jgi:hypothetical protein